MWLLLGSDSTGFEIHKMQGFVKVAIPFTLDTVSSPPFDAS